MDQASDVAKCGSLLIPSVSFFKFKHKKQWIKRYLVLIRQSQSGIQRLEMFASEKSYLKKNNLIKIIPLNNCFRIVQQDQIYQENVFEIHTKEAVNYFSAESCAQMRDWLHLLQSVAFGVEEKKQTNESNCEENVFYSSIEVSCRYKVTIGHSEAAVRCSLYSQTCSNVTQTAKTFYLVFDSSSICLIDETKQIFSWAFRNIRRYGCTQETFSLEAGRKCNSGPGFFLFNTKEGPIIFHLLAEKVKNCFTQSSSLSSASSTVSSSYSINSKISEFNSAQIDYKNLSLNQPNANTTSIFNEIPINQIINKRKTISPFKCENDGCKNNLNDSNDKCLMENEKKSKKKINPFLEKQNNEEEYNDVAFVPKEYFNLTQTSENYLNNNSKENVCNAITPNLTKSSLIFLDANEIEKNVNLISVNNQISNSNNLEKINQKNTTNLLKSKTNVETSNYLDTKSVVKSIRNSKILLKDHKQIINVNEPIFVSRTELFGKVQNQENHYELPEASTFSNNETQIEVNKQDLILIEKNNKTKNDEESNEKKLIKKYSTNSIEGSNKILNQLNNNSLANVEIFLKKLIQNSQLKPSKHFLDLINVANRLNANLSNKTNVKQLLFEPVTEKEETNNLNVSKLILNLDKIDPEHYIQNECEYAKIMKKTFIEHL